VSSNKQFVFYTIVGDDEFIVSVKVRKGKEREKKSIKC
jgi:hypothetical protein